MCNNQAFQESPRISRPRCCCIIYCMHVCAYHGMHMDMRGQLAGVDFSFPYMGPKDQFQVVRLGSKCLNLLRHPTERACRPQHHILYCDWHIAVLSYYLLIDSCPWLGLHSCQKIISFKETHLRLEKSTRLTARFNLIFSSSRIFPKQTFVNLICMTGISCLPEPTALPSVHFQDAAKRSILHSNSSVSSTVLNL